MTLPETHKVSQDQRTLRVLDDQLAGIRSRIQAGDLITIQDCASCTKSGDGTEIGDVWFTLIQVAERDSGALNDQLRILTDEVKNLIKLAQTELEERPDRRSSVADKESWLN